MGTMRWAVLLAFLGCYVQAVPDRLRLTTYTMPVPTTQSPTLSTSISLSPQTSISVHHSIVRNKPAHPYPHTDSPRSDSEDTSYYYTYEDASEEASRTVTSTLATPTAKTTTAKPVKSFWNSQKAILDKRRQESAAKLRPTYGAKPSGAADVKPTYNAAKPSYGAKPKDAKDAKPTFEFKTKERPKFGKNRSAFTTTPPTTTTTTTKSVKTEFTLNLPISKLSEKEALKGSLKSLNAFTNQIVGRSGDIPSAIQNPINSPSTIVNSFEGSGSSGSLDTAASNAQFMENLRKLQQNIQNTQALRDNLQQQAALLTNLKSQPLLSTGTDPRTPQNAQVLGGLNAPAGNAFISATAPIAATTTNNQQKSQVSGLLQRLGQLAANNGGGLANAIAARDGGYGGGNGVTLNLGPVADPLTFFLRLISLIPRPLLDLNGRIFFGIELGKNAGLVSGSAGAAKPSYSG